MVLVGVSQNEVAEPPLAVLAAAVPLAPFDHAGWLKADTLSQKIKIGAASWASSGFGVAPLIYVFYLLKQWAWYAGWRWSCSFAAPRAEPPPTFWTAVTSPTDDAMMRLIVFNLLFEACGFGCASGPLTGRLTLPFPSLVHWLWPGSLKLPFRLDFVDGDAAVPVVTTTRSVFDVALFLAFVGAALRALAAPVLGRAELAPVVGVLMLLGLSDYTILLASRFEVYGYMCVCMCFADSSLGGSVWTGVKLCQAAIWMWASVAKWGPWFPPTVAIMVCNSLIWPFTTDAVHRAMWRDVERHDYRPSKLCVFVSHSGTAMEFCFPLLLLTSAPGTLANQFGLFVAISFHAFIIVQVAMGAPQEWNLFTMIATLFLFGKGGGVSLDDVTSLPPTLLALLSVVLFAVPLLGNVKSRYVSFLPAMRYYAGNWPISMWLIKRSALPKLRRLRSAAGSFHDQAWSVYGDVGVRQSAEAKILAWISLHLHGRLLSTLIPKALGKGQRVGEGEDEYQVHLGEMVAGGALGYNFGDGHLHGPFMLRALQRVCGFGPGECVQVFVDSCPTFGAGRAAGYPWRISDAATTEPLAQGTAPLREVVNAQPY